MYHIILYVYYIIIIIIIPLTIRSKITIRDNEINRITTNRIENKTNNNNFAWLLN